MNDSRAVAIIGMSCAFPGSPNLESFWHSISGGLVHFREVPTERWDHSRFYSPNPRDPEMTYARKVACLDDLRSFAPERYGMPPRRAYPMDPQQRLMLDQARLALDDAGYGGRSLPRSTGVYIGASVSEYKDLVVSRLRSRQILGGEWGEIPVLSEVAAKDAVRDIATIQQYSMVGVLLNMIACSVSEAFDLQGPALVMDAACSSALLAVHEAVLHLREHICDAALVGGVYSICTPDMLVGFSKIGALSKSDVCRPFDSGADGFVLGEGAGAIVLKRLEDAVRDGDRIWAIIRGVGLNNDGRGDGPMTPRLSGQVDALGRAYRDAGISPRSVSYVEAHGTATPVGDMTEISALKENAKIHGGALPSCAVASVKGNIGHPLAAAGIAGLIKAVLVLDRKAIPPQAGLQTPPEKFGLTGSGFYIPTCLQAFDAKPGLPRRAGVNAFGFGGTNVHVVLEESPQATPQCAIASAPEIDAPHLFVISAAKPALLVQHLKALTEFINHSTAPLRDLAYTLNVTRRREDARVAIVASSRKDLAEELERAQACVQADESNDAYLPKPWSAAQQKIAFLFPYQEMMVPNFCSYLCRQFPSFRSRLESLVAELGLPDECFASDFLSAERSCSRKTFASFLPPNDKILKEPVLAAAIQIAMTELAGELGLRPVAVAGSGWGELISAAAGGALEPEAALHLVAKGCVDKKRNGSSNGGGNGHGGPKTSISVSPARIPVISASAPHVHGAADMTRILTREPHSNGDLRHAFRALQDAGANIFIEMGTGNSGVDTKHSASPGEGGATPQFFSFTADDSDPEVSFLKTLGRIAILGVPLDLSSFYAGAKLVSLPSAPVASRPFWVVDGEHRSRKAETDSRTSEGERTPESTLASVTAPTPVPGADQKAAELFLVPPPTGLSVRQHEELHTQVVAAGSEAPHVAPHFAAPQAATKPTANEIRQSVFACIAKVSAYPIEDLKPSQELGTELGFDSLMSVDLYSSLAEAFSEVRDLPQTLIGSETTIEQLILAVADAVSRGRTTKSPEATLEATRRYVIVPADRPLAVRPPYGGLPFEGPIVLIADSIGVAAVLTGRLRQIEREVRLLSPGDALSIDGKTAVIDLSGLDSAGARWDPISLRTPVLSLLRRAAEAGSSGTVPTAFVGVYSGRSNLGLTGVIKSIAREWPKALVRSIELNGDRSPAWIAETIFAELIGTDQSVEVSYASGRRQVLAAVPEITPHRPLRTSAVIAISGGGRGLGSKLALELARLYRARMLLLGRTAAAPELIGSIREAGGEASFVQCDVRDENQVEAAFQMGRKTFGPIEHIVHAAGVLADGPLASRDLDRAAQVFDTKVAGAISLWRAAAPDPIKSFLMYGSWAGRFGSAYQADYGAANHALGRLASVLGDERPGTRVVALDLPPWEGSGMVSAMPEAVRHALRSRVRFLTDETGLAHIVAELAADGDSGEVILGAGLEDNPLVDRATVRLSTDQHPWLEDHRIDGRIVVPFAYLLDQAAAAAMRVGLGPAISFAEIEILGVPSLPDGKAASVVVTAYAKRDSADIEVEMMEDGSRQASLHLRATNARSALSLVSASGGTMPEMSLTEFYGRHTFHGPRLRALASVLEVGPRHASAVLGSELNEAVRGIAFNLLSFDAMMQLCAYWASANLGLIGLPVGADQVCVLNAGEPTLGARVVGVLEDSSGDVLTANLDLLDSTGRAVLQVRGLRCRLIHHAASNLYPKEDATPTPDADTTKWRIEEFPEVKALRERIETARKIGLADPYFSVHERVTRETSLIGGNEYVNFASYNYLGLSGDTDVTAAAVEALHRYGTSVSASRLASGEKPLHRELEGEIADFLGCEDSIVMVGGHATNVSVIGHLFGPQDLVVHDSLAHDSILAGIRLSGAKRRPFPHNDAGALDQILRQSRGTARRVLIAVEGVYSMDGDVPPLPKIVEIKRHHKALLLVDEAHSLGVLGKTGRGVGEHYGIDRKQVDLWMGTLSKALASCGGYIAGSAELVRYLKYSNPGFVYSVGISPANAAASLAALRKLRAHPGLVETLRERSSLFLEMSRRHGLNTGSSEGTAVVPCIVGDSLHSLRLARALGERRINVQPIMYPVVEENLARLRFFLTARHSEQQIISTVRAVAEELGKINPKVLKPRPSLPLPRTITPSPGGQSDAAVS